MNIHVYLMCFNEEQIIYQILEHYSKFCSRIYVLDNMSTDNSLEIASEFDKVRVISWGSQNKFNDLLNLRLKENVPRYLSSYSSLSHEKADWVIVADMDEVIYHQNILSILEQAKAEQADVIPTTGYNMVSDTLPNKLTPITHQIRFGVRAPMFDKPIIFNPRVKIKFSPGCHPKGERYEETFNSGDIKFSCQSLFLLHYKHIGERFIHSAVSNRKRLSDINLKRGWGVHYQGSEQDLLDRTNNWKSQAVEVIDSNGAINFD